MASHRAPKADGKEGIGPLGFSFIYVVVISLLGFFCVRNRSLSHLTLTEKIHMSWSPELFKSSKRNIIFACGIFLQLGISRKYRDIFLGDRSEEKQSNFIFEAHSTHRCALHTQIENRKQMLLHVYFF